MTTTHEVKASQTATPVLVQAIEPIPGLYVYAYPEELRSENDTHVWRLGHHSGLQIAKFKYCGDAEDAAELIAPLADWTRAAAELRATEGLGDRVAARITYDTPGVLTLNSQPITA